MKKLFISTGEMAKLHSINKKTLIYYDEIGLFHPHHKDDRGYRFYDVSQHFNLEVILSLRNIDISIKELIAYKTNRSPASFLTLLKDKSNLVEEKINRLQALKTMMDKKIEALERFESVGEIEINYHETEYLRVIHISAQMIDSEQVEDILSKLDDSSFYVRIWGSLMSLEEMHSQGPYGFDKLYVKVKSFDHKSCIVKPSGHYLDVYHKGDESSFGNTYDMIKSYVKANNLELEGPVYEESVIDDLSTDQADAYITRIMIRIKNEKDSDFNGLTPSRMPV